MEHHSNSPNCPYCVRLATLIQSFERMSLRAHQWIARPVPGIFVSLEGNVRRYVLAAYSNPHPAQLPNTLVFGVPLIIHRVHPGDEPELRACFDKKSIVPLSIGLYWKDDDLKYDQLKDWNRFWNPIEKCLQTPPAEWLECQKANDVCRNETDRRTLDGISYRDSLCAYVTQWSQSKEKLQNAVR